MMRAQSYVACRAWLFSERLQFLMSPLATRCSSAAPTAIMALVTTTQPRPKSEGNLVSTARMISPHQHRHSFVCPGPGRDGVVSFFFFSLFFSFFFVFIFCGFYSLALALGGKVCPVVSWKRLALRNHKRIPCRCQPMA